jgi:hypothetical protein
LSLPGIVLVGALALFEEIDRHNAERTQDGPKHLVPVEERDTEKFGAGAVEKRHPEKRHKWHRYPEINRMKTPPHNIPKLQKTAFDWQYSEANKKFGICNLLPI